MASRKRQSSRKKGFNISNELLALLLVVAISLSMVDFFLGSDDVFTGYSSVDTNASAAVTIESVTAINWTSAAIDWGTGSVTEGFENATLDTDAKTVTGGNWTASSHQDTISLKMIESIRSGGGEGVGLETPMILNPVSSLQTF